MNKKLLLVCALLTGTAGLSASDIRSTLVRSTLAVGAAYALYRLGNWLFSGAQVQAQPAVAVAQPVVENQQPQRPSRYNPDVFVALGLQAEGVRGRADINRICGMSFRFASLECKQLLDEIVAATLLEGPRGASDDLKAILFETGVAELSICFISPLAASTDRMIKVTVNAYDDKKSLQDFAVRLYRILNNPDNTSSNPLAAPRRA